MSPYKSCNCRQCRYSAAKPGGRRRKTYAHRAWRRESKVRMLRGDDSAFVVSTGYPS